MKTKYLHTQHLQVPRLKSENTNHRVIDVNKEYQLGYQYSGSIGLQTIYNMQKCLCQTKQNI